MISVTLILVILAIIVILYTFNFLGITHEAEGIKVQEDTLEVQEIYSDRIGEIADK